MPAGEYKSEMKTILVGALAVLLLSHCSGRARGTDLQPLTAEQSEDLKKATLRFGPALTFVSGAMVRDKEWPHLSHLELFWFPAIRRPNLDTSWLGLDFEPKLYDNLRNALSDALKDGRCETSLPPQLVTSGGTPELWGIQDTELHLVIKGDACPVHYDELTTLDRVNERILRGSQSRKITLRAQELITAAGIAEINFSQSAELERSEDLLKIPSKGVIEIEGTIAFTDHGTRPFYILLSGHTTFKDPKAEDHKDSHLEIVYGLELPAFTGELKFLNDHVVDASREISQQFLLNGKPVTSKDFKRFIDF